MMYGYSIGSARGAATAGPKKVQGQQQPLMDLRVTGAEYGQPIPYVRGAAAIAGQMWWNTDRRATTTTTTESSGGKGGGGVETSSSTITYDMDCLLGLTDNEIIGVARIWKNGELVYTADSGATAGSIAASAATNLWTSLTVYTGDAAQLPDPTYEAAVGTANACAYRGRGSVVIEGLKLGQSGQVPNLVFEVVADGSTEIIDVVLSTGPWFDPTSKASGITLTNSDRTAENTGGVPGTVKIFGATAIVTIDVGGSGIAMEAIPAGFDYATSAGLVGYNYDGVGYRASHGGADWMEVDADPVNNPDNGNYTLSGAPGSFTVGDRVGISVSSGPASFSWNETALGTVVVSGRGLAEFSDIGLRLGVGEKGTLGSINYDQASVTTIAPPTVASVVSDLCLRAGLTAGQIDVTGLSTITRTVDSLAISQIAPTRQALELLMSAYFFEMTISDKLYFRPRGASSVASIPYLDLGATKGDDQPEPLALKQANDLEIPAQIALSYINIDDDYQTDTQYSDRLISAASGTVAAVQMALGMTPAIAKAVADTMLLDQAASAIGTQISLLGDYCRLEPTDPVTVTGADGSTFRLRLVRKTDSYPLLTFDAVLDDVSVLTSQGITSADYTSSTVVAPAVNTEMELMDIPILQDADNDAGFYVAAKGDGTPYAGSAIFNSADNVEYTRKATVLESAVFGTCTTTLGDWTGGRVFDEQNSVTVNVGDGTLASSTRTAILNSLSTNAMLIGSEIIQFKTATLVSAGVYTLTGLLRGGRGTEWAMVDHVASERAVLLRVAGLRRVVLENSELGLSLYYKGVTLGRALSSATAEQFTDNSVGLKPFSPILLKAGRDGSNNITFTWQRRTRLGVRMIGALGISIPLGETSEAYEIDIYASSAYATVLRTITAASETASYTAAQQTTDGLTPGDPVYCKAYQVSAEIGRGYALQKAA